MSGPWKVVIPSDSRRRLEKSVPTILKAHPKLELNRIHIISHKLRAPLFQKNHALNGVKLIPDENPEFVYARRINMALSREDGLDSVLMGDDVEVITPNAFDILSEEAPLRLLAASVRGRVGPWWQKEETAVADAPFVSFTCVYLPQDVVSMVGHLEDKFPGYGYEDTDYCIRVRRAGLSIGVCGKVVIAHNIGISSQFMDTYKAKLTVMQNEARLAFLQKWRKPGTR